MAASHTGDLARNPGTCPDWDPLAHKLALNPLGHTGQGSFPFNLVIFSHLPADRLSSLGLSCRASTGLPAFLPLGCLSLLPSESPLVADSHWAGCLGLALHQSIQIHYKVIYFICSCYLEDCLKLPFFGKLYLHISVLESKAAAGVLLQFKY